jgi:hypothetical protein
MLSGRTADSVRQELIQATMHVTDPMHALVPTRAPADGNDLLLWSFHKSDFSLIEGTVDHRYSEYYRCDPGIRDAYRRLWDHLGTDQVVWCYRQRGDFSGRHPGKKQWALRVPRSAVVAFVNRYVWARIIGSRHFAPPRTLRRKWKEEVLGTFPHDHDARKVLEDAKYAGFWNEQPPANGWWSTVFVPGPGGEGIDALLRHPVERKWLLGLSTK